MSDTSFRHALTWLGFAHSGTFQSIEAPAEPHELKAKLRLFKAQQS